MPPLPYSTIIFDLFGTIVAPFRRAEHVVAIQTCAEALRISGDNCHRLWVDSFPKRVRGRFESVGANFEWIVEHSGGELKPDRLERAVEIYERFTLEGLAPAPGALDLFVWVRARDIRIGLITNCAPDIPLLWERSAFAPWFDHCTFSSLVGSVKPEPEIYSSALLALGADPSSVLYVGDGSDEELTGALAAGMTPVLVANDLSNTYDRQRKDVDGWSGRRVGALGEIRDLLSTTQTVG